MFFNLWFYRILIKNRLCRIIISTWIISPPECNFAALSLSRYWNVAQKYFQFALFASDWKIFWGEHDALVLEGWEFSRLLQNAHHERPIDFIVISSHAMKGEAIPIWNVLEWNNNVNPNALPRKKAIDSPKNASSGEVWVKMGFGWKKHIFVGIFRVERESRKNFW